MSTEEKRTAKRISYVCEVECEGAGISHLVTRINDLSTTGAFVDSIVSFSPGSMLKLKFRIKDIPIETTAEVRYSMPTMGMGVQFLNLKPNHCAALESLVEDKPLVLPEPLAELDSGTSNAPEMLVGNFAVVSMFDVIQIIENNKLTGTLCVNSHATNGEIHFNDGQIVGARNGDRSGIDALRLFLDVIQGSFEFTRSQAAHPRTIDASSNMSLMLNLLRVKDEEAALN